jgi:V/A-type H+-transporting ATPase subunit E
MNGLGKITERILLDAKEKAREILETAQAECRAVAESYAEKAEALRDEISAAAEAEGEALISRAKSAAAMTRRNLLLSTRAALIDEAFERAGRELCDDSFGKYRELLCALLVSALLEQHRAEQQSIEFGDEVEEFECFEVLFNEKDRERFGAQVIADARRTVERRIGAQKAAKIELGAQCADIDGGLVLRFGDVELNCTLGVLMADIRRELETRVAGILFAEKGN